jgi:hypothetical protein
VSAGNHAEARLCDLWMAHQKPRRLPAVRSKARNFHAWLSRREKVMTTATVTEILPKTRVRVHTLTASERDAFRRCQPLTAEELHERNVYTDPCGGSSSPYGF